MAVTLPFPPSANAIWRRMGRRMVKSDEARRFAAVVGTIVRQAGAKPLAGDVELRIDLHPPSSRFDADNPVKALLDALQGCAYSNDRQVRRYGVTKHEPDPADPRAVVEILEIAGDGGKDGAE